MPLDPICILYCKQCNIMYEYNICWFSRFGFPGENPLCNVCICHCIFSILFRISVYIRHYTRLEFTFGIKSLLALGGCLCRQGFGSGL
jgi:hypothetical protein